MLLAVYSSGQCPTSEKKRYTCEAEAYMAADHIFDTYAVTLRPYCCPCGLWHLTSTSNRRTILPIMFAPPMKRGRRSRKRRLQRRRD